MDFEYMNCITIESTDIRKMYLRVKNGEKFSDVFYDIMSGYDDDVFYSCDNIEEQVHEEILRRLKQNKNNQKNY